MSDKGYVSRRALWVNRLSDEVVRGIVGRIRSGTLSAGAALPSRAALMSEFVTSDGVIEQAVHKLVGKGLVMRDADGVLRVQYRSAAGEFEIPQAEKATLADVIAVLELRVGVETEAAALAAVRRSGAELAAIRSAAEDFAKAADDGLDPAHADYRFHLAIGDASGNRYLHDLTDYLGPLFIPRMRIGLPLAGSEGDANLRNAKAEHAAIVDAIAGCDAAAARAAMHRHLARTLDLMRGMQAPAGTRTPVPITDSP